MSAKEPIHIPTLPLENILLPNSLQDLDDLAYNLAWTWSPQTMALFRHMAWQRWQHYRNPVEQILGHDWHVWKPLVEDPVFQSSYEAVVQDLRQYMTGMDSSWFSRHFSDWEGGPVAYFSMEYGLHDCLQLYSGGLGVLSGDHLKAAGDLGVPLVAVGLLYAHGYFYQEIGPWGRQQHIYPDYDFMRLPLRAVRSPTGGPLLVPVEFPGRTVHAKVWLVQVGRVPLLLLDTNIRINDPADRPITGQLYVAGRAMRLCQEIVLGVGGVRALRALGIGPSVWHLNEGHSALLCLERIREALRSGAGSLAEAADRVRSTTVFTTHTPVPAGQEQFDRELTARYLRLLDSESGVRSEELLALGTPPGDGDRPFSLTVLALRLSAFCNGVSALHAEVSRKMWGWIRDASGDGTAPITGITNGVHAPTWIGRDIRLLLERRSGVEWQELFHEENGTWGQFVAELPDEGLWEAHQNQKDRLFRVVREQVRDQLARHGFSPGELRATQEMFSTDFFTIGFARRFATYKRGGLLFTDPDRLRALVTRPDRPVQIIFAGKSHPADEPGQAMLQRVYQYSKDPAFSGRIVVLENYTMGLARLLVGGVDLWLNNPRRPLEASGTSGMKAALNGVVNCSILDGWWDEGYDGQNGWEIGGRGEFGSEDEQDRHDAYATYGLLEDEIVPLFYEREGEGLPLGWLQKMKASMASLAVRFSADRMVRDYVYSAYAPLMRSAGKTVSSSGSQCPNPSF
ncbi:MAG: alpha-glucan family phosphorylase [Nitrospinota bacterium]